MQPHVDVSDNACVTVSSRITSAWLFVSTLLLFFLAGVPGFAQAPLAPSFNSLGATTSKCTLGWATSAGATSYNIFRATTTGGEGTTALVTGVTGTSYQDTTVSNGTPYFYKVSAVNASGQSPQSGERSNTPIAAPTPFAATPGNGAVTLAWGSATGAISYNVYRGTASNGETIVATAIPGLSYTDVPPLNNTTYFYQVTAAIPATQVESSKSTEVSAATSSSLLLAPTLWATPGTTTISLTWNSVAGASTYNIKRSSVIGGPYTTLSSPSSTSYVDTPPTTSGTYYYVVTAVSTVESANSNEVAASAVNGLSASSLADTYTQQASPTVNVGRTTPLSAQGTSGSQRQIYLTFPLTGLGGGIVSAKLKLYKYGGSTDSETVYGVTPGWGETTATWNSPPTASGTSIATLATGATGQYYLYDVSSYAVAQLAAGATSISFEVTSTATSASNFYARENSSNVPQFVVTVGPPVTPTGLTATGGAHQIQLSWNISPGATSYKLYRGTGIGSTPTLYQSGLTGTSYSDTGLADATYYTYSLSAVNSNGESTQSSVVTGETLAAVPVGVSATPGNAQIPLAWTASTGATGYNVKRATLTGGPYTTVNSTPLTGTTLVDSSLTNGTAYYYVVTALDAGGESANSPEVTATPAVTPGTPAGLTATPDDGMATLSWTAATNATAYNVKYSTTSGGPYTNLVTGVAATNVHANLTNGTTYYFVVSAVNIDIEGANSTEANTTPILPGSVLETGKWHISITGSGSATNTPNWVPPAADVTTFTYPAILGSELIYCKPGESCTSNVDVSATVTLTWVPGPGKTFITDPPSPSKFYIDERAFIFAGASGYSGDTFTATANDAFSDTEVPSSQDPPAPPYSSGGYGVTSQGDHFTLIDGSSGTATLHRTFSSSATAATVINPYYAPMGGGADGQVKYTVTIPPPLSLWDAADNWSTHLDFSDGNIANITPQMIANQETSTPFKKVEGSIADGTSKILIEFDSTTSDPVTFNIQGPSLGLYAIPGGTQSIPVQKAPGLYASYAVLSVADVKDAFPNSGDMYNEDVVIANSGTATDVQILLLGRPPVVLVHGIWSNPSTWSGPTGVMASLQSAGFYATAADYERTNHSSYETNKDVLITRRGGIQRAINHYHGMRWAISKADVIGHSMGGLVTRYFASQPEYVNVDNYWKGYVHRLVTIGSPHMGSPESQLYFWFYLSYYNTLDPYALEYLVFSNVDQRRLPGLAVRDLSPGSAASGLIRSPSYPANLPVFAEVGNAGSNAGFVANICQLFMANDTHLLIDSLVFVDASQTDSVVSGISQQGGLSSPYFSLTNNVLHVPVPLLTMPCEQLDARIGADVVAQLYSDNFDSNGFPSPSASDPNNGLNLVPAMGNPWPDPRLVDPDGLPLFPLLPLSGTVSVASPIPGQIFAPGDSLVVTFAPNSGTTIGSAAIGASSSDGNTVGMSTITASPYMATYTIPQNVVGNVKVASIVWDTNGTASQTTTNIIVRPTATLRSITVTPSTPITLNGVGETQQLQVNGAFSDSITRDVTAYQTAYVSASPAICTVSGGGLLTAVANGTAMITARNGSVVSTFPVTVNVQIPQIAATRPLGANAGQTFMLRLDGTNFGGATAIQFLTPGGISDTNITVSGLSLSSDGYMLTANVTIAAGCPLEKDTIKVTASGGASDPTASGDLAAFTVLPTSNALSVSPNTVSGVHTLQGKVLLSAPAPDAGVTMNLSSSDASVTVPANVVVYPGCISATFLVTTSQVTSSKTVTITATKSGTNITTILTETP